MPRVRALHFGGVVAVPRVLVSEVNKLAQPLCDVSVGTVVTPAAASLCTRPQITDPGHASPLDASAAGARLSQTARNRTLKGTVAWGVQLLSRGNKGGSHPH